MAKFIDDSSRNWDSVETQLYGPVARVQTDVSTGVDGSVHTNLGRHPRPQRVATEEGVADLAAVNSAITDYEDLVGQIGTIIDNQGRTTANVAVIALSGLRVQQAKSGVGFTVTDPGYVLTAAWTVSVA